MKRHRWMYAAAAIWIAAAIQGEKTTTIFAAEERLESNTEVQETVSDPALELPTEEPNISAPEPELPTEEPNISAPPLGPPTEEAGTPVPLPEPSTEEASTPVPLPEPSTEEPGTPLPLPEPSTEEPGTPLPLPEPSIEEPGTPLPLPEPSTEEPGTPLPLPEPSTEEPGTPVTMPEPSTEEASTSEPSPSDNPASNPGKIHLGIDNRHIYSGMSKSFTDGYEPSVTVSSVLLVIPFTASSALKDHTLTVDLSFDEKSTTPFEMKNYQKDVEKKIYFFDKDGVVTKDQTKAKDSSETYLYRCKLLLLPDAAPGQYPVTVKASGYTEQGEKITLDYRLFIRIPEKNADEVVVIGSEEENVGGGGYYGGGFGGGETEDVIHQPKMLLESFSLSGRELEAGDTEDMTISFRNRSDSQAMYNLKIIVSSQDTGLKLSKNSYYFTKVSPGEEIAVENTLKVSKDAEASEVPLIFTFEYEDSKGTSSTGTEQVNVSITQPVRMELETYDLPSVVFASDTVELSVKALNLSRTAVYNVRVNLSGTGLFPKEALFFGNIEAGSSGEDTVRIYVGTRTMEAIGQDTGTDDAEKYGPVTGTITLTYEDALGTPYEVTKEYKTEIKKAQILSLNVSEEEPEANSWWYSVFTVLIAALVLLILLLFWSLRRKTMLLKEARGEET